jgi:hypothetical protein
VNCEVCGTELPHGAMFCGECGRAVAQRPPVDVDFAPPPVPAPVGMEVPPAPPAYGPRDTVIIDAADLALLAPPKVERASTQAAPPEAKEPKVQSKLQGAPASDIEQDLAPDSDPDGESYGDPIEDAQANAAGKSPDKAPGWTLRGADIFTDADDLEQTLIVPKREQGERFVLQFSTGESITVFGSGLLGRNPTPQPGEYFDQLVVISDPGKSVSKTHLEFGQEGGSFWVSDRFSGNGSVVREPEASARRLTAGKRYRIVRGSRVDIAEQFFIVS